MVSEIKHFKRQIPLTMETKVTLTTDASNQGFGGFKEKKYYQGSCSGKNKSLHINHMEIEAVNKSISHFLPNFKTMGISNSKQISFEP